MRSQGFTSRIRDKNLEGTRTRPCTQAELASRPPLRALLLSSGRRRRTRQAYLSHADGDQGFDLMEYHGLVGELNKRLGPAERERAQTRAVAADQYQRLGLCHLGLNAAHGGQV